MNLPRKVREAGEAADRAIEEARKAQNQAMESQNQPEVKAEEPTPAESPKPKTDGEDWEKRFKGYKQSSDRTIAELRTTVRELESKIESMNHKKVEQEPPVQTKQPVTRDAVLAKLTEEQREEYDTDFIDTVISVARAVIDDEIKPVASTMEEFKAQHAKTLKKQFLDDIMNPVSGVPNYMDINQEETFVKWVGEFDPVYGATRQQVINQSLDRLDAQPIIALYKQYLSIPKPEPKPDPRENMITPESGGSAGNVSNEPMITGAFIEKFYSDVSRGKYRNNPKEAERIETQIRAAYKSGR